MCGCVRSSASEVPMLPPLLERKQTHFVFWRPGPDTSPPKLVVGVLTAGTPATLAQRQEIPLAASADSGEVWGVAATDCGLTDGQVYHYWFETADTRPSRTSD